MKQRHSGLPFDDILQLVNSLPAGNQDIASHTVAQLGEGNHRAAKICEWYSLWSGRSPVIHRPLLTLFAGTHSTQNGLDGGKMDAWLLEEVAGVAAGEATVNRLCHLQDMGLKLFDLALQMPVADITQEPALDEKSCAGTIAFGMEAIAGGSDLLAVCAIENEPSISALAIICCLSGLSPEDLAGDHADKKAAIEQAVSQVHGHEKNPLEVLRRLGGRETSAICGAILSARTEHIPTVIDGVTALAACLILAKVNANSVAHCMIAQGFDHLILDRVASDLGLELLLKDRQTNAVGAGVATGVGLVKSACKHFPVADV